MAIEATIRKSSANFTSTLGDDPSLSLSNSDRRTATDRKDSSSLNGTSQKWVQHFALTHCNYLPVMFPKHNKKIKIICPELDWQTDRISSYENSKIIYII